MNVFRVRRSHDTSVYQLDDFAFLYKVTYGAPNKVIKYIPPSALSFDHSILQELLAFILAIFVTLFSSPHSCVAYLRLYLERETCYQWVAPSTGNRYISL